MANGTFPRPLTSSERAVIALILSAVEDHHALRLELGHALVTSTWASGPSVDIEVPSGLPRHDGAAGVLPTTAHVRDASGTPVGELLLWIEDGSLSALEYAWYTEDPPARLPEVAAVEVTTQGT